MNDGAFGSEGAPAGALAARVVHAAHTAALADQSKWVRHASFLREHLRSIGRSGHYAINRNACASIALDASAAARFASYARIASYALSCSNTGLMFGYFT